MRTNAAGPGRGPLPPVLSIVGKSDSGKTTLLERLIPALAARGLRVGALKHDAHDYETDTPGKDSHRLRSAGARATAVASATKISLVETWDREPALYDIVARYFPDVDLVLTEGYKRGPAPKIEVVRAARSTEGICTPDELVAVVTDVDVDFGVPRVALDDVEAVAEVVVGWLEAQR